MHIKMYIYILHIMLIIPFFISRAEEIFFIPKLKISNKSYLILFKFFYLLIWRGLYIQQTPRCDVKKC